MVIGNSEGVGEVSKAKVLKEHMKPNWNLSEKLWFVGVQTTKPSMIMEWGGYRFFSWNHTL